MLHDELLYDATNVEVCTIVEGCRGNGTVQSGGG